MRLQPDIAGILMPADKACGLRLLDEQGGAGDKDIRPDYILHRIEDTLVMRNPVQHRQHVMRVVAPGRLQLLAMCRFGGVELGMDLRHFFGGEDVDRGDEPVALIGGLLRLGQSFRHKSFP